VRRLITKLGCASSAVPKSQRAEPKVGSTVKLRCLQPALTLPLTEGEDANGVSRASSVSAKDKQNGGKRKPTKQRRDDSEGFESRSHYVQWCPGPHHPTWAAPVTPQYFPISAAPFNAQFQQPYPNAPQPMYPPAQPYNPQMMPNGPFAPQYTTMGPVSSILEERRVRRY